MILIMEQGFFDFTAKTNCFTISWLFIRAVRFKWMTAVASTDVILPLLSYKWYAYPGLNFFFLCPRNFHCFHLHPVHRFGSTFIDEFECLELLHFEVVRGESRY